MGFNTFVSNVKKLLKANNLSELFHMDFISIYFQRQFAENCLQSLKKYFSLQLYIQYKNKFQIEHYREHVIDYKSRKCVSKIRMNSGNVPVEKGHRCKPIMPC